MHQGRHTLCSCFALELVENYGFSEGLEPNDADGLFFSDADTFAIIAALIEEWPDEYNVLETLDRETVYAPQAYEEIYGGDLEPQDPLEQDMYDESDGKLESYTFI